VFYILYIFYIFTSKCLIEARLMMLIVEKLGARIREKLFIKLLGPFPFLLNVSFK